MARYQVSFRHPDGDRIELHDTTDGEQPRINGQPLTNGHKLTFKDIEWLVTADGDAERSAGDALTRACCDGWHARSPGRRPCEWRIRRSV